MGKSVEKRTLDQIAQLHREGVTESRAARKVGFASVKTMRRWLVDRGHENPWDWVEVEFGRPRERRDYRWPQVVELLMARPGEWAVVHQNIPASTPYAVNKGTVAAVAPWKGFRTRVEGTKNPEGSPRYVEKLWMMYDPALVEDREHWLARQERRG